jgi:hypothetical protein
MKILRILLIILVPAMGIVGCRKSNTRPASQNGGCQSHQNSTANPPTDNSSNSNMAAGRGTATDDQLDPTQSSTEIYGSGDDDRNGGEKRKKRQ